MAIELEKIKPWDGQSGTGADNRGVIDRNFEKVKDELEAVDAKFSDVEDEIVQLAGDYAKVSKVMGVEDLTQDRVSGEYIQRNTVVGGTLNLTPRESGLSKYAATYPSYTMLDCNEGDIFEVRTTVNPVANLYLFIDDNNVLLKIGAEDTTDIDTYIVIAPENATKVIFHTYNNVDGTYLWKINGKRYKELFDGLAQLEGDLSNYAKVSKVNSIEQRVGVEDLTQDRVSGEYIQKNTVVGGTLNLTPMESVLSKYAATYPSYTMLDCNEGDIFEVRTTVNPVANLYLFIDDNNVLLKHGSEVTTDIDTYIVIAPENATKVIFHTYNNVDGTYLWKINGKRYKELFESISILQDEIFEANYIDLKGDLIDGEYIDIWAKVGDVIDTDALRKTSGLSKYDPNYPFLYFDNSQEGDVFEIRSDSKNGLRLYTFIDENSNIIKISDINSSEAKDRPIIVIAPKNTSKVIFNVYMNTEGSHIYKVIDVKYLDLLKREKKIDTSGLLFVKKSSNLIDYSNFTFGYTIGVSGDVTPNRASAISDFFKVKPNTKYVTNSIRRWSGRWAYYDADKNLIGTSATEQGSDEYYFLITTPPDTAFARISFNIASAHREPQVNEGSVLMPYEPYEITTRNIDVINGVQKSSPLRTLRLIDDSIPNDFEAKWEYASHDEATFQASHYSTVYDSYNLLVDDFPSYVSREERGEDSFGNKIYSYHFKPSKPSVGRDTKFPKIFITTGTHGREKAAVETTRLLMNHICRDWSEDKTLEILRHNVEFIIMPIVNPSGFNAYKRRSQTNMVDINRNFPTFDWEEGSYGSSTYGGTSPASELETQAVLSVFNEHPDIDIMNDFHNFHLTGSSDATNFIVNYNSSLQTQFLSSVFLSWITRKWSKEFDFIPKDDDFFIGISERIKGGTICNYAQDFLDTSLTGTLEICYKVHLDPNGSTYDSNVWKMGVEALVHWIRFNIEELYR